MLDRFVAIETSAIEHRSSASRFFISHVVVVESSMVFAGIVAYQLHGIVSLGITSGHFFDPASVKRDYQGQLNIPVTNLKGLVTSS